MDSKNLYTSDYLAVTMGVAYIARVSVHSVVQRNCAAKLS